MNNSYKKAMDKITLSDEKKNEILSRYEDSLTKNSVSHKNKLQKYSLLAACLLICFISINAINTKIKKNALSDNSTYSKNASLKTREYLADEAAKEESVISYIPDGYKQVSQSIIMGKITQTTYMSDTDTIVLRSADISDDLSGDFNEYDICESYTVNDEKITLKGNIDLFFTATKTGAGTSYSVTSLTGLSKNEMVNLIEGFKKQQ